MLTTKASQLRSYLRNMGIFATHHTTEWGASYCYNEPTRLMRRLRKAGEIQELTDDQKKAIGKENSVESWWVYIKNPLYHNKEKYEKIGIEI